MVSSAERILDCLAAGRRTNFLRHPTLEFIACLVRRGACSVLLLIGCGGPAWAQPVFQCDFDELIVCGESIGCSSESNEEIEFPRQVEIDIASSSFTSTDDVKNLRRSTAENIEERAGVYFFQAIQRARSGSGNVVGWTVFLDSKSLKISGSAVNADLVFNVFGECETRSE